MVLSMGKHCLSDAALSVLHVAVAGPVLVQRRVLHVAPRQLRSHHRVRSLDRGQAFVDDLVANVTLV